MSCAPTDTVSLSATGKSEMSPGDVFVIETPVAAAMGVPKRGRRRRNKKRIGAPSARRGWSLHQRSAL